MSAATVLAAYKAELETLIAAADISQRRELVELLALTNQAIAASGGAGGGGDASEATLQQVRDRLRVSDFSIGAVTTAATGTQYTALESGAATAITIRNRTGTMIEVRRVGGTNILQVEDREDLPLPVLANSNEWEIRRSDTSNTQVSIRFLRYTA